MRYSKHLPFICALTSTLLAGFALAGPSTFNKAPARATPAGSGQEHLSPQVVATSVSSDYVRAAQLWPPLRDVLRAFGDRMEKPGKERLTMTGTLERTGAPAVPLAVVSEFPGRLRLAWQDAAGAHVITFDERAATTAADLSQFEQELLETLIYDTAEHFFAGQVRGAATRALGERFRLDDGTAARYEGSLYDIYQVVDMVKMPSGARQQTKLYYFNSDALLLEQVRYETERAGAPVRVEVQLGGYQSVQGQQVPTRIVRRENGRPALTVAIGSVTVSPAGADGIFGPA
ncbi:MAG: hypothetical protein ACJ74W_00195 [Pyrinomonadaceae bacterium]